MDGRLLTRIMGSGSAQNSLDASNNHASRTKSRSAEKPTRHLTKCQRGY
jgi:hypothetical protein